MTAQPSARPLATASTADTKTALSTSSKVGAQQSDSNQQSDSKVQGHEDAHSQNTVGNSMAVYTEVSQEDLEPWLTPYKLGTLVDFQGVSEGVENTNFRLNIEQQGKTTAFFLTLFERHTLEEAPYFIELLQHLKLQGVKVAAPLEDSHGQSLRPLKGKPAVLMPCVEGHHPDPANIDQCRQVGEYLAQLHLAGRDFSLSKSNPRGHRWWEQKGHELAAQLNVFDANLMLDELGYLQDHWPQPAILPYGVIHADLFKDNVFFQGDKLTSAIDFYNAGDDFWLFDLAICANDWCHRQDYLLDKTRLKALLDGYRVHRRLNELEAHFWPLMLRAAAMRFWCSRLEDLLLYQKQPVVGLKPKNPDVMKHILIDRQRHNYSL